MSDHQDDDEAFCVGDVDLAAIDPEQLEQVAALFDESEPLDALAALYGDDLVLP